MPLSSFYGCSNCFFSPTLFITSVLSLSLLPPWWHRILGRKTEADRMHPSGLAEKHPAPYSAKPRLLHVQLTLTKADPTAYFIKTSVRFSLSWVAVPTHEISFTHYTKIIFSELMKQETSLGWNLNCSILENFPLGNWFLVRFQKCFGRIADGGSIILEVSVMLYWVATPFSRGSSPPGDWTQVSCIAGGFFIVWASREALVILEKITLTLAFLYQKRQHYGWI